MDSKEMTGSIAKGIASFVLTILTLRGFRYVFSNNWLESIVIVVVATVVLYKWGVKWFGSYLWRRKLRTIGALICGFYLTTTGRIEEAGIFTKIEYFWAGFLVSCVIMAVMAKPIQICVRILKHEAIYGPDGGYGGGSYSGSSAAGVSDKWDREQQAADAARKEADRRAKERYDARTNELKAEYDARTADGWGKDRAAQNFRNDADYWRKQQKKY